MPWTSAIPMSAREHLRRGDASTVAAAHADDQPGGICQAERLVLRGPTEPGRGPHEPTLERVGDLGLGQRHRGQGIEARVRREQQLADPVGTLRGSGVPDRVKRARCVERNGPLALRTSPPR